MSQHVDLVFAIVLFVGGLVFALASFPLFIEQPTRGLTNTQTGEALDIISDFGKQRNVFLRQDCNTFSFDCNSFYPVEIDFNTYYNPLFSRPFFQDDNKIYSVMKAGWQASLFLFTNSAPTKDDNQDYLDLNSTSLTGRIEVSNSLMDANLYDTNTTIKLSDSYSFNIAYQSKTLSLEDDSNAFSKVVDSSSGFRLMFFPSVQEFWVFLPLDQNITIDSNQSTIELDNNVYLSRAKNWWDYNYNDSESWQYRVPLTINSGNTSQSDIVVGLDINFEKMFNLLGVDAGADSAGFRVVEYTDINSLDFNILSPELEPVEYETSYNATNEMLNLLVKVSGTTNAFSSRNYFVYFDSNSTSKSAYSETDLSPEALSPYPVLIIGYPEKQIDQNKYIYNEKALFFNPNSLMVEFFNRQDSEKLARVNGYSNNCVIGMNNYATIDCNFPALIKFRFRHKDLNSETLIRPFFVLSSITDKRLASSSRILAPSTSTYFYSFENNKRELTNPGFQRTEITASTETSILVVKNDGNLEQGTLKIRVPKKGDAS